MNLNKTILRYFLFTAGIFLFDKIYALFGHGVTSHWMSNAYLYLFGLGVPIFSLFRFFLPDIVDSKGYWLFLNTYNSGVAILINGMLLYGILEIAGGTSDFVTWFLYAGSALIAAALVMLVPILFNKTRKATER